MKDMKLLKTVALLLLAFWVSEADAQQCRVTGPSCSDAKEQCRQIRKRAAPARSYNPYPCINRFNRCMAGGRWVSRNCNVVMQKR